MKRITRAELEEVQKRMSRFIDQINQAFGDVQLEEGIGLREADGIDDYASEQILAAPREQDERHDWRKIPRELLRRSHSTLSFFDEKGLRFHLPAFLIAELEECLIGGVADRLVYGGFPAQGFVQLLTVEQRQALITCLSFYGSLPELFQWFEPVDIQEAIMRIMSRT